MLRNVFQVFVSGEFLPLLTFRRDYTNQAIIEVHPVLIIHHPHIVRAVGIGVGKYQANVVAILQNNILKDLQSELTELYGIGGNLLKLLLHFRRECLATPPGKPNTGCAAFRLPAPSVRASGGAWQ